MYPIIISVGPVHIFSYGFLIAVGLFLSFVIAHKRGVRNELSPDTLIDLMIAVTCAGIAGARLWYVLSTFEYYRSNIGEIFQIWEGGLVLYGGTLAGLACIGGYAFLKKQSFFALTDALIPYFAFVQGFGRLGCFMNGCCGGKPSSSVLAITFPGTSCAVYPTQIYSAEFDFCLALFLFWFAGKRMQTGAVTSAYFLIYGAGRFCIEFLRTNQPVFAGLSEAQLVSLAVMLIAMVITVKKRLWRIHEA